MAAIDVLDAALYPPRVPTIASAAGVPRCACPVPCWDAAADGMVGRVPHRPVRAAVPPSRSGVSVRRPRLHAPGEQVRLPPSTDPTATT